jgi:hypothetical protein
MRQGLTEDLLDALTQGVLKPAIFFEIALANETAYFWSGLGPLSTLGESWQGVGSLLSFSSLEEREGVVASGIQMRLSGIPEGLVSLAIDEVVQQKEVRLYIGFLDDDDNLIDDPVGVFFGYADIPEVTDDEQTCEIRLTVENALARLRTSNGWRYNLESWQVLYPDDDTLNLVPGLVEKEVVWRLPS